MDRAVKSSSWLLVSEPEVKHQSSAWKKPLTKAWQFAPESFIFNPSEPQTPFPCIWSSSQSPRNRLLHLRVETLWLFSSTAVTLFWFEGASADCLRSGGHCSTSTFPDLHATRSWLCHLISLTEAGVVDSCRLAVELCTMQLPIRDLCLVS